jgi:hypothetical protein
MTLDLTEEDIIKVGAALGEFPFKEVAELIGKIQTQFNEQKEAKEAP